MFSFMLPRTSAMEVCVGDGDCGKKLYFLKLGMTFMDILRFLHRNIVNYLFPTSSGNSTSNKNYLHPFDIVCKICVLLGQRTVREMIRVGYITPLLNLPLRYSIHYISFIYLFYDVNLIFHWPVQRKRHNIRFALKVLFIF